jgi:formylglycine-generating enzyme required for sulfatase activity
MPDPAKGIGATDTLHELEIGKSYLLVIAIDDYLRVPKLYNCVSDANAFVELLVGQYSFNELNIIRIFNRDATAPTIHNAFRKLIRMVQPADNLVIYFSGHGEFDPLTEEGYWVPVDAEIDAHYQYITNDSIRRYVGKINSLHTFLISDSCFSGSLFAKGASKNISKRYEKDPSRWGLTAGRNDIVSDGKPGMHSPFADALLYRLESNDNALGVSELCAYVVEQVQAHANQSPIGEPLRVEGHKNGQFVFRKKILEKEGQEFHKQEEVAWHNAKSMNTFEGYQEYLERFPKGIYHSEVFQAIAEIIKGSQSEQSNFLVEEVFVKGGNYKMGCTSEQGKNCLDHEKPVHSVTLDDFYIGKLPITNSQFGTFLNEVGIQVLEGSPWFDLSASKLEEKSGKFFPKKGFEIHPITGVNWFGAKAFCEWLSQKSSRSYRLPTEAEWEYAARGGQASQFYQYAGSNTAEDVAWYASNIHQGTMPVGRKKPNELGIHDMSGNAWEWCSDWYGPYTPEDQDNPKGPDTGEYRVIRGGSWKNKVVSCRVSDRYYFNPKICYLSFGFRVVRHI